MVTRHRPGDQDTWIRGMARHPFPSLALNFPISEMVIEGPTKLSMSSQSLENAAVWGSILGLGCQANQVQIAAPPLLNCATLGVSGPLSGPQSPPL